MKGKNENVHFIEMGKGEKTYVACLGSCNKNAQIVAVINGGYGGYGDKRNIWKS